MITVSSNHTVGRVMRDEHLLHGLKTHAINESCSAGGEKIW
jgi:hypothetical protein